MSTTWLRVPGVGRHETAAMDICRAGGSYVGEHVRCPGGRVLVDVRVVLEAAGLEHEVADRPDMPGLTREEVYVVSRCWEVLL